MDDQRTNRESGGSVVRKQLAYAARGFLSTIIVLSCGLSVLFAVMGAWEYVSPTPAYKGHSLGYAPPTLIQFVLEGLYYRAIVGAILGAAGGAAVGLMRVARIFFPTT